MQQLAAVKCLNVVVHISCGSACHVSMPRGGFVLTDQRSSSDLALHWL